MVEEIKLHEAKMFISIFIFKEQTFHAGTTVLPMSQSTLIWKWPFCQPPLLFFDALSPQHCSIDRRTTVCQAVMNSVLFINKQIKFISISLKKYDQTQTIGTEAFIASFMLFSPQCVINSFVFGCAENFVIHFSLLPIS